jgi:hypothetical protein
MLFKFKRQSVAIALAMSGLASIVTGCGQAPTAGVITPPAVNGPGTPTIAGTGACLPLNTAIGFQARNYVKTDHTIKIGTMATEYDKWARTAPAGTGVVTLMSAVTVGGPYTTLSNRPDGSLTIAFVPEGNTMRADGMLTISQDRISPVLSYGAAGLNPFGPFGNYPTPVVTPMVGTPVVNNQGVCVRSLALSMSIQSFTNITPPDPKATTSNLANGSVVLDTTVGQMILWF